METKLKIKNLQDMLQSEAYQIYESETLLNIQYHIINTDKDVDEMVLCQDNGLFGCTNRDFIECWEEYLNTLKVWDSKYNTRQEKKDYDITLKVYNTILRDIRKTEAYHIDHFTYNDII